MDIASEISKIRHRVFKEVARLHWEKRLVSDADELPELLVNQHQQRYRCCEYKEKAIYAERIKLAMGLTLENNPKKPLGQAAQEALTCSAVAGCQVEVIDIACDSCPINKFFVTNACRNCLVHSCQMSCPRGAISVVQNQAYIDQNRCVECGLCKKSCRYGAILEIHRPCEQSCGVKAIVSGEDRKAVIDHNKCVSCGACVVSCPFGAISDRSQLLHVITLLQEEQQVVAVVAPSIVGQFGQKGNIAPVYEALQKLGFQQVVEAAQGADLVAMAESGEFLRQVPHEQDFLTSSCCPAFVNLVKMHKPELSENISSYVSPMLATAGMIKEQYPQAKVVFIGPCIAKKGEAIGKSLIDAVLTFEELKALLEGAGIEIAKEGIEGVETPSSQLGLGFAASGGVTKALMACLPLEKQKEVQGLQAQGLEDCLQALNQLQNKDSKANYLEGMACSGGCLGGPGVLVDSRFSKRYLQEHKQKQVNSAPLDNPVVQEVLSGHPAYLHHSGEGEKE